MNIKALSMTALATTVLAISPAALAGGGLGSGIALFDEMLPTIAPGSVNLSAPGIGDFYAGQGMTMSASEPMWFGNGVSNGDFGNFDIEGTNGPAFLSFWEPAPGGTITFTFDNPVNFLVDLITSQNGDGNDVICTVTTMLDGSIVQTEILTLPAPIGDPDGEFIFRSYGGADTIHFQLAPNSNRVFAFDYIEWFDLSCGSADLNGDGFLDFFDISAYIAQFSAGCD